MYKDLLPGLTVSRSLNRYPTEDDILVTSVSTLLQPGASASMASEGSIAVTVIPTVGFQIQLDALGRELVNTDITASFANSAILKVGANSADCDGAYYGFDHNLDVAIDITNPLPGFDVGSRHISVLDSTHTVRPMECRSRRKLAGKRDAEQPFGFEPGRRALAPRSPTVNTLFPDPWGTAISCPENTNTTTGNCHVSILADNGRSTAGSALSKRDLDDDDDYMEAEKRTLHLLEKRSEKKDGAVCNGRIRMFSRPYPTSGEMIRDVSTHPFKTYGPKNPDDCDDYSKLHDVHLHLSCLSML